MSLVGLRQRRVVVRVLILAPTFGFSFFTLRVFGLMKFVFGFLVGGLGLVMTNAVSVMLLALLAFLIEQILSNRFFAGPRRHTASSSVTEAQAKVA